MTCRFHIKGISAIHISSIESNSANGSLDAEMELVLFWAVFSALNDVNMGKGVEIECRLIK